MTKKHPKLRNKQTHASMFLKSLSLLVISMYFFFSLFQVIWSLEDLSTLPYVATDLLLDFLYFTRPVTLKWHQNDIIWHLSVYLTFYFWRQLTSYSVLMCHLIAMDNALLCGWPCITMHVVQMKDYFLYFQKIVKVLNLEELLLVVSHYNG